MEKIVFIYCGANDMVSKPLTVTTIGVNLTPHPAPTNSVRPFWANNYHLNVSQCGQKVCSQLWRLALPLCPGRVITHLLIRESGSEF